MVNRNNATVDPFADPGANVQDDSFDVDLTDVQSNFRIPAGQYEGVLTDLTKQVSEAGNPMWVWKFRLTRGENAGREFSTFTALTPQALWKVAEVVEALGLGAQGSASKFSRADAIGRLATLNIVDDNYKGQERSSIGSVSAHPDGAGTRAKAPGQP